MTTGDAELLSIAAALSRHDIPRLGWPTSVVPPVGTHVRASERGGAVTITVTTTDGSSEAFARLDLDTREVVVDAFGGDAVRQRDLRRVALSFTDDRNAFDERCGINVHPWPPMFVQEDTSTWSPMQILAYSTIGYWYPPLPGPGDMNGWMQFFTLSGRFNGALRALSAEATTQRSTLPRGGRSSGDPATPDRQGLAGA